VRRASELRASDKQKEWNQKKKKDEKSKTHCLTVLLNKTKTNNKVREKSR